MLRLCLLLAVLAAPAAAQTSTVTPVRVGVIDAPPFSMRDGRGAQTGLAVDLFRLAADELGLAPDFVPAETLEGALADGASIVLPVEGSSDAEAVADLTHPVFTATLGTATERRSRVLAVVDGLISLEFLRMLAGLSALLLVVGAVVWLLERRRNEDMFHRSPLRGLGDGFWWAGVTLTTIGYGDKAPATVLGRAVAMIWMLVGLAVSASLTAAVVTLADGGGGSLSLPEDLRDRRVAVVAGTTADGYADRQGLERARHADPAAAIAAVVDGQADVALGSAPALRVAAEGTALTVVSTRIDPILIAFAVVEGDPLREELNRVLLDLIPSEAGQAVVRRYLPDG